VLEPNVDSNTWSADNAGMQRKHNAIAASSALVTCVLFACVFLPSAAAQAPTSPGAAQQEVAAEESAAIPPPSTEYKGREIAQTMHFLGAPWLTRESRDREEDCKTMLAALKVKPGDTVCDLGCGNGFYTIKLAQAVGDRGRVLAVDIQREMLELLKDRAAEEKITNIETVLGTVVDPKLPENSVDLVLLVDVYHEFSHPEQMLATIRKCLKPKGRIALVEFRAEDPKVPIKPLHKMSKAQIMKEFPPNGFKLVEEFDKLPWQHLMFFERDADTKDTKPKRPADAAIEPKPAAELQ
jgi:ubiquinone/menaquinone biosynthesis C-methylase UbiE